jgi:glycosyltransferase involved in cell wall biosynthesis
LSYCATQLEDEPVTRRLRIASIYETLHLGGDEQRLLNFARGLDRSRFEHVLFCCEEPPPERVQRLGSVRGIFEQHGVEVVFLSSRKTNPGGKFKRGRVVLSRLTRQLRHRAIDVVDGRMGYGLIFGSVGGRQAGVAGITATEYNTETFWERPGFKHLAVLGIGLADVLLSDSKAQLAKLQAWLPRPHPRPMVIPNGMFPPQPHCTREEMRAKLSLPLDPKLRIIGAVGRLVPYRGQHVLIEAVPKILAAVPDAAFLICGFRSHDEANVSYPEKLLARAEELGVAERVSITQYPGSSDDIWAAIDVLVHPTFLDSSPLCVHEAMALERPMVVTSAGGIPELVTDGENGLMVEPGDAQALADATIRVLSDPALADRLRRAGLERFNRRHRAQVMTDSFCQLYTELYERARRPRRAAA